MIVILLNNKLLTCDTVIPFAAEIAKRYPDVPVEFLSFDIKSEKAIRENVVLWDILCEIGPFIQMGREKPGAAHWLIHRLRTVLRLSRYAILAAFGRVSFIHFKALNFWPLRMLAVIAGKRVCYMQPTSVGVGELEQRVSEAMVTRRKVTILPAVGMMVAFNENWPFLTDDRLADKPRCFLPPTYTYSAWLDVVLNKAPAYYKDLFSRNGQADSEAVVTYILSSMDENGLLSEPHLFPELFEKTLAALEKSGCTDPILVKTHPATSPKYRAVIAETIERHGSLNIVLCDLHPVVLALRSRFVIANCYSTTFSVFSDLGVPTVEFTSYRKDILEITENGSLRPEMVSHFIDSDEEQLNRLLVTLAAREPNYELRGTTPDFPDDLKACLALASPQD